jgi:hypothetical protein
MIRLNMLLCVIAAIVCVVLLRYDKDSRCVQPNGFMVVIPVPKLDMGHLPIGKYIVSYSLKNQSDTVLRILGTDET